MSWIMPPRRFKAFDLTELFREVLAPQIVVWHAGPMRPSGFFGFETESRPAAVPRQQAGDLLRVAARVQLRADTSLVRDGGRTRLNRKGLARLMHADA